MCTCYLIQRHNFRDIEALPSGFKRLVEGTSGFDLSFGWHVVATDEKESDVHKDELPHRNFRRRCIRGISRNGTALCQHFRVGLDVRSKSNLYDVMNSIWGRSPDSFHEVLTSEQNFGRACSRCDFLVDFGTASSDDSPSRSTRELNSASSNRTSSTLHENSSPLNRARDMDRAMSGDPGNAEARTLFQRHTCG